VNDAVARTDRKRFVPARRRLAFRATPSVVVLFVFEHPKKIRGNLRQEA
jgi:hypothetical protein